ncbi:MAG: hypothetical protein R3B57_05425 [Phycisphaerales bacterium]
MRDVNRSKAVTSLLVAAALGVTTGGAALAQDSGAKTDEAPLLSGPKVEDTHAPGSDSRFGEGMEPSKEMERPIPLRWYEQELRALGAPDAPEDVRLTADQTTEIRKILDEHRQALRAFFREHREELMQLRRDAGAPDVPPMDGDAPRRPGQDGTLRQRPGNDAQKPAPEGERPRQGERPGQGQKPGAGEKPGQGAKPGADRPGAGPGAPGATEGDKATQEAARRKLAELRAKGPSDDVAIKKIWSVLNEAQHARIEQDIEALRAEMMRRREMEKLGERDAGNGANGGAGAKPGELDRLPPGVRERLEKMTPEERERALERLRRRREAGREGEGGARPKAPPSIDDVDLPDTHD